MKYVLTVQRVYETEVVVDFPEGTSFTEANSYPTRHLDLRHGDFELVGETIDDVREYEGEDDEHLDVMDYIP